MAQRSLMSIRLIGVVHKEKSKMYMTSVLWSDHNDIVVYRGFRDFKELHKQMKKAFPPANPLKKSDRIIPKFQGKKLKGAQKKGPSKSVLRLKSLEKYCSELLSCDPRMPQNQELIQFFLPNKEDLQPDFAKNSIVILPSEDNMGHEKKANVGNVTQPFVTETYRCVAPYETKDTKNRPFKVALDESVDVLIKDKAGWWLVENEDKRLAWFPAPYLEKIEDEDNENDRPGTCGENVTYCAARNYKATNGDEVSLNIGSVVEVLQKSDNGWWTIRYRGSVGYVPSMYLQPYNNPRVRLMGLNQDLHRSKLIMASMDTPGRSNELSRSQGNLLQPSGLHPSSANQLHPADKQKSRSLNMLSEPVAEARPETGVGANLASPSNAEEGGVHRDGRRRSLTGGDRKDSLSSEGSDSDFSDLSSSSGGSSPGRTPPPAVTDRLGADSGVADEPKMTPSNHKAPVVPKVPPKVPVVPPRPQAQEILTRCSTVTRRKAARVELSAAAAEITMVA